MAAPARPSLANEGTSALDVGLGSIVACRHFIVPATILVLIRDVRRVSWDDLFLRCALRRSAGHVVGRKGLGEPPINPVRPTAVMFDDLIGDLGHASLLMLVDELKAHLNRGIVLNLGVFNASQYVQYHPP